MPIDPTERHSVLVELVHVDLERRLDRDNTVRIERYLEKYPTLAEDRAAVIELIAAEYRFRKRRDPNLTAQVFANRFPQYGAELPSQLDQPPAQRRRFPVHLNCPHCRNPIEIVAHGADEEVLCPSCGSSFRLDPDRTQSWAKDKLPKLGKFELIEAVGRGAFGTVYRARDTQLQRIVAVKVPRSGQLATDEDEDRFVREARNAAQLQHPGIVPVHEVGRSETFPFIVSEFVEGVTLSDALTAQQLGFKEAAQLVARVADALQHAHSQGVVHRDLKPSNIMLTADGAPRVMDFGLAKRDAGEITVTVEGQVLGTPAYMSPEQASGQSHHVDGRSDVYSLGVILFELLTGELPFRGNQRMLLHNVIHNEPRAPRSLNDRIPRDLETICLKAMAKEPGRRYQTAQAMAEDLRCFLTGQPITARPVGRVERSWRWCRRNAMVASLLATVALALVTGTAVSTFFAIRATTERDRADAQAAEAIAERERAEEGFREARETVDKYFTKVSQSTLLDVPGLQPLRKELLESALEHYEKFIGRYGDDPKIRAEMAESYARVGNITSRIASKEQSLAALHKAVEIYGELVRTIPTVPDYQVGLAAASANLGIVQSAMGRSDEAEESFNRAIEILDKLVRDNPTVAMHLSNLAIVCIKRGVLQHETGRSAKAEGSLNRAVEILDKLVRENPTASTYLSSLATAYSDLEILQRATGRSAEADASYKKEIEICQTLVREYPADPDNQYQLANAYNGNGIVQRDAGRLSEAEESYTRAIDIFDKLVRDNPSVANYQDQLARTCHNLGVVQRKTGRQVEAEVSYKRAIEIDERLIQENPAVTAYQAMLAIKLNSLGILQEASGRNAEGEALYQRAIEIREKLVRENPTITEYQFGLATACHTLGTLQSKTGRLTQAEALYERAIEIREKLVRENPTITEYQFGLADASQSLGVVQGKAMRHVDAEASFKRAIEIDGRLVRENPAVAKYQADLIDIYVRLGGTQSDEGRLAEAEASYINAIEIGEKLVRENPTVGDYSSTLIQNYAYVAYMQRKAGRSSDADAMDHRALEFCEKFVRDNPTIASFQDGLAAACNRLAGTERAAGRPADAEAFYLRATAILEKLVHDNPANQGYKLTLGSSLTGRGDILGAAKKWREAVELYAKAVELNENHWYYLFQLALLQLAVGDETGYRASCAHLLQLKGDTSVPYEAFVVALTCSVGDRAVNDLEKIVALAKKATEADAKNPGHWTALGGAQFRAGQTQEAIDTLKKAMPLHTLAAFAAPGQLDQIQTSRLAGETFLAMAYQKQGDQAAVEKQRAVVKALVSQLEKSPPKPSGGIGPWGIAFAIEMANRELARIETPAKDNSAKESKESAVSAPQ